MTRTMYDAVTPGNLPEGGDLYAGYLDGRYRNVAAIQARFPGKRVVTISVTGMVPADVLDVEAGNITPDKAPDWAQWMRGQGRTPTVYCPSSLWGDCIRAFTGRGINPPLWWVAHYDDDPTLTPGMVAKQYGGDTAGGFDISAVADYWPGIDTGDNMLDQSDKDFISSHFSAATPPVPYEQGSLHYIVRNRNYLDGQNDAVLAHVAAVLTALPTGASTAGVAPSNVAAILDALAERLKA